ncbi:phage major capsid protein [Cystobacter fuscus]
MMIPDSVKKEMKALAKAEAEAAVASRVSAVTATAGTSVTAQPVQKHLPTEARKSFGLKMTQAFITKAADKVSEASKAFVTKAAGALAGTFNQGGSLLPEEYSSELIEALCDVSVLLAAGARVQTYHGKFNIGKLNGGAVAQFVNEGSAPTGTTLSTDSVILGSKKCAAVLDASNDMLKNPNFDSMSALGADMVQAVTVAVDKAGLVGDGVGPNPTGLTNQLASSQTFAATGPTATIASIIADLDKAERLVRESKIPFQGNSPGWVMSSKTLMRLKSLRDSAGWVFRNQLDQGMLNGYPVYVTDSIATENIVVFGLFKQLYFGVERDLEVASAEPNFAADLTTLRGVTNVDFKVRHDTAFSVITSTNIW